MQHVCHCGYDTWQACVSQPQQAHAYRHSEGSTLPPPPIRHARLCTGSQKLIVLPSASRFIQPVPLPFNADIVP
jgi:hypothetical protein